MSVRHVDADDFETDAAMQNLFHMRGDFLDCFPQRMIIFVVEVVNFVDLNFWHDQNVTRLLRIDVEEGKSSLVLVDFVRRDFAADDFGENAVGHGDILAQISLSARGLLMLKCI